MSGPYKNEGLERASLKDITVKEAMSRVPRHRFVPRSLRRAAYRDRALSIGMGQTISQPFIVALMTEKAKISTGSKVLEIGTGSGYQAAVLAELGASVFSIEIVPELHEQAQQVLHDLGYDRHVQLRLGDGWEGWPDEAPFDAILVTAASPRVPAKLLAQLANHGRLVFPLEEGKGDGEKLFVIEKADDSYISEDLGAVRFVPLVGEAREEVSPLEEEFPATVNALKISPENSDAGGDNVTPLEKAPEKK